MHRNRKSIQQHCPKSACQHVATHEVVFQSKFSSRSQNALRKIATASLVLSRFIGLQQGDPDVTFDKLPAGEPMAPLQPGITLLDLRAVSYQQLMDLSAASAPNPFGELLPFDPGVLPSRLGYMTGGASKPICTLCGFGLICCIFMCCSGTLNGLQVCQTFGLASVVRYVTFTDMSRMHQNLALRLSCVFKGLCLVLDTRFAKLAS